MRLPQEICDLIIDHLHDDKLSLRRSALVSRGWVYRSQAHLFYLLIFGRKLLRRWFDTFSPSDERIHSFVKFLKLCPSSDFFGDFVHLQEYAPAFKNLEHLLINGRTSRYEHHQFPCIRWFGHLKNTLKSLHLENAVVDPRIVAGFPRLEFLLVRSSKLPSVLSVDGIYELVDDIPAKSDFHDAFKGTVKFDIHSWDSETGLLAAFADCPLNYDTIRIDVKAAGRKKSAGNAINRLISRCSDTLEVLDINFADERLREFSPVQNRSCLAHTLPTTDTGLNLSLFKRLREISLAHVVYHRMNIYLPRFADITSGAVSKITIVAKLGSGAKELYSLFGGEYDWSYVDNDLLRLVEFQGGNNTRRVEVVIDLRRVRFEPPDPSGRERKSLERNWWIQRASRYTFPKFSQAGTIDFILPTPVSIFVFYFRVGGTFKARQTNSRIS